MRIAQVIHEISVPTYLTIFNNLGRQFHSQGHHVISIGLKSRAAEPRREKTPWGIAYRIGSPNGGKLHRYAPPLFWICAGLQLAKTLRQEQVDVVHFHAPTKMAFPIVGIIPWLGIPLLTTLHAHDRPPGLRGWLCKMWLRYLAFISQALTVESKSVLPKLAELPSWGRAVAVHNGVELPGADTLRPASSAAKPYILSLAEIRPGKGLDLVALAFSDIRAAGHDVEWAIVGKETDKRHLEDFTERLRIRPSVRFIGEVPRAEADEWIRGCLFFTLTPRNETFGLAILEAMSFGKAVIASRVGGIPEYLQDGQNGILVPLGDISGLKEAMSRLLESPSFREKLGANARRTAAAWGWDGPAHKYIEIYEKITQRAGRS